MNIQKIISCLLSGSFIFISTQALSEVKRVRVVNKTDNTIYIHKGGYSPSVVIEAGKWRIFNYPFSVVPPNKTKKISSSLLVATAGGRWITTPNGYTYLDKLSMLSCLDYSEPLSKSKSGNRVWIIKNSEQQDKNCNVSGYKQVWYQPQ